jgi:ATP-dependent RNA helicase RhlE
VIFKYEKGNLFMSFENLNLIEPILKALKTEGYTAPTPIQQKAIPVILDRRDLLGCAQTGTGKTAAFAIPVLQILYSEKQPEKKDKTIKALILTPTRELAIQIGESFNAYGRHTGLRHRVIFGGVPQKAQTDALRSGVDILVATPGRLLDLMQQGFISLQNVKMFVLDEADRMLDMGFINDVKKVIAKLPSKKQTMLFSATMPQDIQKLSSTILVNPSHVAVTPVSSTVDMIKQSVYFVDKSNKKSLLIHLLKDTKIASALVFTRTKHGANKVAQDLAKAGIIAEAIHGNKSQSARQKALSNFKAKRTRVLVATDIAARGIDVEDLSHVINYEMSNVAETYVHRIGRTGRAGAAGTALSFCDAEEKLYLKDVCKLINKTIPVVEDHPFPMKNQEPVSTPRENMGQNTQGSERKRSFSSKDRNRRWKRKLNH